MLPPLNIGNNSQLFVDNYLIELVNFVTKTMHQPIKHSDNPLITKDKPWEILPYLNFYKFAGLAALSVDSAIILIKRKAYTKSGMKTWGGITKNSWTCKNQYPIVMLVKPLE